MMHKTRKLRMQLRHGVSACCINRHVYTVPNATPSPHFIHLPQEQQDHPERAIKKCKSREFISLLLIGIADKDY